MSLSRHNDEILNGMKNFADRLVREKQKAHDNAELLKRQLQECENSRLQLLDELAKSSRIVANQRVRIQEGENELKNLQDKLKISDTQQGTLQDKLHAFEAAISQINSEQSDLRDAVADRLIQYESAVEVIKERNKHLSSQLLEESQKLISLHRALEEKEKLIKAAEKNAADHSNAFASEKTLLLSRINSCKEEKEHLVEQIQRAARDKAAAAEVRMALQQKLSSSEQQHADDLATFKKQKEDLSAALKASQEERERNKAALASHISTLQEQDVEIEALKSQAQNVNLKLEELSLAVSTANEQLSTETRRFSELQGITANELAEKQRNINILEGEAKEQTAKLTAAEAKIGHLEESLAALQSESEQNKESLEKRLKDQEIKCWTEKERLKKLQDDFAEQYESLGRRHTKEVKVLQQQREQHLKELAAAVAKAQQKQDEVVSVQKSVDRLEAARMTATAIHAAQLEEATRTKEAAVQQGQEAAAAMEKEFSVERAGLHAEVEQLRKAATEAEARRRDEVGEAQRASEAKAAEVERQKAEVLRKDAELVSAASAKQKELAEQAQQHEQAMKKLQQDHELTTSAMAAKNEALVARTGELESDLEHVKKQLAAKEASLDGMRGQARVRENRLAELMTDLENKEELLKCISSAAATAQKTPGKMKPRPPPPVQPPPRFSDHEQLNRRRSSSKKRKVVAEENYLSLTSQGADQLRQRQQHQQRLARKGFGASKKSGRTIFSSMSAEPVQHGAAPTSAALGLFGSEIAHPY